MEIKKLIGKEFIIFDGAMGTMLQRYGLKAGEIPEEYNITHSGIIEKIHKEYIGAGANTITTNTFGANEYKLKESKYTLEKIIKAAVANAKKARENTDKEIFIVLDIGPIGQLMEPMGTLSFEKAYEIFRKTIIVGANEGCDAILIETMSDIYEARAAILAAKEACSLPIFCTMTFDETGRTLTGTDTLSMITVLEGLKVDALGINCSLGPKETYPLVKDILKNASIPVMVQPNAGLPRVEAGNTVYDVSPKEFGIYIDLMAEEGSCILGGCCGTNPEYIKELSRVLENKKVKKIDKKNFTACSSGTKTVVFDKDINVIGERINPTGKKKFKEALLSGNMDYILNEAVMQSKAGATVLDVNVGLPEIDEKVIMIKTIKEIQSILNIPLQIDSVKSEVIEAAVRIYNGKPIINSVNGKKNEMEKIFPIVEKYGACVIGLTLDERGIPSKAEERYEIAEKIVSTAAHYGIDKKDIFIDCLVLTASAQQEDVLETLKAVRMVKEKLGVKTVLGVSNVSFGLPERAILNKTFLAMALMSGLDAPIANPMAEGVMETVSAYKVFANMDVQSKEYINRVSKQDKKIEVVNEEEKNLKDIIILGFKDQAGKITKKLLESETSLNIVDNYLIPALDLVGKKYEKGEIFLPQLIISAETVKKSFEVLKEDMTNKGEKEISKGKIILATVYGDIHDIGKNIVKILLENYGYEIIDLGKDVPIEKVVDEAIKHKVKLVGLSALMTTTVSNMEATIKALKAKSLDCRVMVGGAVLNEEYAKMINADYYAKDAQEAVEIAKTIFK